jgi:hypothetical protein
MFLLLFCIVHSFFAFPLLESAGTLYKRSALQERPQFEIIRPSKYIDLTLNQFKYQSKVFRGYNHSVQIKFGHNFWYSNDIPSHQVQLNVCNNDTLIAPIRAIINDFPEDIQDSPEKGVTEKLIDVYHDDIEDDGVLELVIPYTNMNLGLLFSRRSIAGKILDIKLQDITRGNSTVEFA